MGRKQCKLKKIKNNGLDFEPNFQDNRLSNIFRVYFSESASKTDFMLKNLDMNHV